MPVYSLPWLFCTGPLTLLLLLVIVARAQSVSTRTKVEQAAMAAAIKTVAVQNETARRAVEPPVPCRFQHGLTGLGCIRMGYGLGAQTPPDRAGQIFAYTSKRP